MVRLVLNYAVAVALSAALGVVPYVLYRATTLAAIEVPESAVSMYAADPELGFVMRPGLNLAPPMTLATDSSGARVDRAGDVTPEQAGLLAVGCSQTYGQAVPNEATFPSLTAKKLNLGLANFAVSGFGGTGALGMLRRQLGRKPSVIVYGLWEDHIERNVQRCLENGSPICIERPVVRFDGQDRPFLDPPRRAATAMNLQRRLLEAKQEAPLAQFMELALIAGGTAWQDVSSSLLGYGEPRSPEQKARATIFVLDEMKRAADSVGARLVVVFLPLYFDERLNEPPPAITVFAHERGIVLVSMAARLRELRRQGVAIAIPGDGHITREVHAAVAKEVVTALRSPGAIGAALFASEGVRK